MARRRARRSIAAVVLAAAIVLAGAIGRAAAQPPPPELTAPVNDFAGVIDAASARSLDELIRALEAASGDAVVVATVRTFQPWPDIQSYATRMFENAGRGVGARGKDNGVLVLLAVDDRQVRVEVGYDLEGAVTDGFAGETSRQVMAPYFRRGEYGQGLLAGTTRIVERIAADRNVTVTGVRVSPPDTPTRDPLSFNAVVLFFVLFFIVLPLLNRRAGRRRRRGWRGGVGPWGGGYYGGTWGGGSSWGGSSWGGSSGGFGGFGGGRSGGGGGGASW
jgi:uncharacterized protein